MPLIKFEIIRNVSNSVVDMMNVASKLKEKGLGSYIKVNDYIIATSTPIGQLKAICISEVLSQYRPGEVFVLAGTDYQWIK